MGAFMKKEIKLRLSETSALDRLLSDPALVGAAAEDFETFYYDTRDLSLLASNLAYIVNDTPEGFLGEINPTDTLEGGVFTMEEWNRVQSGPGPELEVFRGLNVWPRLVAAAGGRELVLLFRARFRRFGSVLSPEEGCRIELLLDVGELIAGDRREELMELKLILLAGSEELLDGAAKEFSLHYALVPEGRTKHRRGLVLAGLIED